MLFCFLASVMLPHSDSLSIPEVSFVVNPEMFPGRPLLNARTQACVTFRPAMFVVLYGHKYSVRIFYRKEEYKCFLFVDDESLLFAVAHYCTLWIMFTWMPSKFVPLQPCLKWHKRHCNAKAGFSLTKWSFWLSVNILQIPSETFFFNLTAVLKLPISHTCVLHILTWVSEFRNTHWRWGVFVLAAKGESFCLLTLNHTLICTLEQDLWHYS